MGVIVEISKENFQDINQPNEPFAVIGRLIPTYTQGVWTFTECLYDEPYEKVYPNENESWEAYIDHPNKTVFFVYEAGRCVGQIRLRRNWNHYAYIEDIAVARDHRGKGVGTRLMERAVEWAREKGLCGLMLETQDVNLQACRFYLKMGFQIGAIDTMLYANFDNAHEIAIFWYKQLV